MSKPPKIVCVVPARLGSTRFPRKMLADLHGKPLIQWAYEGAKSCPQFSEVVVAVDHVELLDAVAKFGGRAIMTSPYCKSGTDRLCELARKELIEGDIWVNWQGDEPFITKEAISQLLQSIDCREEEIWTLKRRIETPEEIASMHVVKVVADQKGSALYFSRSPIPFRAEVAHKHVGIYAYRKEALQKISALPPSPLEEAEKLEQLRFLEGGLSIRLHETSEEIFGIDTKEELAKAAFLCYD